MASGNPRSTGQKPKGSGGEKAGKLSQKEQSERFKQTARELEADETGEAFEEAMRIVTTPRKPG